MAWQNERMGADHEGWLEPAAPADLGTNPAGGITALRAACTCGWRSTRWAPVGPATWHPHQVEADERDVLSGREAWQRHIHTILKAKGGAEQAMSLTDEQLDDLRAAARWRSRGELGVRISPEELEQLIEEVSQGRRRDQRLTEFVEELRQGRWSLGGVFFELLRIQGRIQ